LKEPNASILYHEDGKSFLQAVCREQQSPTRRKRHYEYLDTTAMDSQTYETTRKMEKNYKTKHSVLIKLPVTVVKSRRL